MKITLQGPAADKLRRLMAEENYDRPEDAVADALDALVSRAVPGLFESGGIHKLGEAVDSFVVDGGEGTWRIQGICGFG